MNEITDSYLIFQEVESAYQEIDDKPRLSEALETLLGRAKPSWTSLKALIEAIRIEDLNGIITVHRYKWLKQRSRAKLLQEELRYVRTLMHEVLCNHSS